MWLRTVSLCSAVVVVCSLDGASGLTAAEQNGEGVSPPRLLVRRRQEPEAEPATTEAPEESPTSCNDGMTVANRANIVDDDLQDLNVSLQLAKDHATNYQPSPSGLAQLNGLTSRVIRDCKDLIKNSFCARTFVAQQAATDALVEKLRKGLQRKAQKRRKVWHEADTRSLEDPGSEDPVDAADEAATTTPAADESILTPEAANSAFDQMVVELQDVSRAVAGANVAEQNPGGLQDEGNLNLFMDEMLTVIKETRDVKAKAKKLLQRIKVAQDDGSLAQSADSLAQLIEKTEQKAVASSSSSLMRREAS